MHFCMSSWEKFLSGKDGGEKWLKEWSLSELETEAKSLEMDLEATVQRLTDIQEQCNETEDAVNEESGLKQSRLSEKYRMLRRKHEITKSEYAAELIDLIFTYLMLESKIHISEDDITSNLDRTDSRKHETLQVKEATLDTIRQEVSDRIHNELHLPSHREVLKQPVEQIDTSDTVGTTELDFDIPDIEDDFPGTPPEDHAKSACVSIVVEVFGYEIADRLYSEDRIEDREN